MSWSLLAPGGSLISTVSPPDAERARAAGVQATFVVTPPVGATLAVIASRIDSGEIEPLPVAAVRPLEELPDIHRAGEARSLPGKTVLAIGTP